MLHEDRVNEAAGISGTDFAPRVRYSEAQDMKKAPPLSSGGAIFT